MITAYGTPSAQPAAMGASAAQQAVLAVDRRPVHDRSWDIGISPTGGMLAVFVDTNTWIGPSIKFDVSGNYYFSRYSPYCVGGSLGYSYAMLVADNIDLPDFDFMVMNMDFYYGRQGSRAGTSFGYKIGFTLDFPFLCDGAMLI